MKIYCKDCEMFLFEKHGTFGGIVSSIQGEQEKKEHVEFKDGYRCLDCAKRKKNGSKD